MIHRVAIWLRLRTAALGVVASGAVAASVLWLINAPVPFLTGGLLGAWICAVMARRTVDTPAPVDAAIQGAIGGIVGLSFESDALRNIANAGLPMVIVIAASIALSVACGLLLVIGGVSKRTAVFASVAGGASGIVPLARDLGGDDRVVGALQYLRVALIVLFLPAAIQLFPDGDGSKAVLSEQGPTLLEQGLGIGFVVCLVAASLLYGRFGWSGVPVVLIGLVVGWALSASSYGTQIEVPGWLESGVLLLMGVSIGARFTAELSGQLLRLMPLGFLVITLVLAVCAGLGLLLSWWTERPLIDGYLATTPGGLPAVLAAGAATEADTTFVSSAQVLRLLLVLLGGPIFVRGLLARRRRVEVRTPRDLSL